MDRGGGKKSIAVAKPEVKRSSVEVTITSKSALPEAADLARKYGVQEDDEDGGGGDRDRDRDRGLPLEQQMEFIQRQQRLVQKVEVRACVRVCVCVRALLCATGANFPSPTHTHTYIPPHIRRVSQKTSRSTVCARCSKRSNLFREWIRRSTGGSSRIPTPIWWISAMPR